MVMAERYGDEAGATDPEDYILQDRGLDILQQRDQHGQTLMMYICWLGRYEYLRDILELDDDFNPDAEHVSEPLFLDQDEVCFVVVSFFCRLFFHRTK